MKALRPARLAAALVVAVAALLQACSGIPQDNSYQNRGRGGGWENFRAAAPEPVVTRPS